MQRRTDGWHLELVAFGAGQTRPDEQVAALGSFKELHPMPRRGDGWVRRDFGLSLDAKGGHEQLPIHVATLAYGAAETVDFVPDLSSADGVLFLECGDEALDGRVAKIMDDALAMRPGSPPRIVERGAGNAVKEPLRELVKRAVKALKAGELLEFWRQSVRNAEVAHDAEVYGPLTKEKILARRRVSSWRSCSASCRSEVVARSRPDVCRPQRHSSVA